MEDSIKTIALTVIVPVYKVKREYLVECLNSIDDNRSLCSDYELILVDDGAPSDTAKFLDEYALDREYVRVLHQENAGVAVARNNALKLARGKYVTFIDSDDTISKDYFSKIISRADKDELEVLMWGMYRSFQDGRKIPFSPYNADIDLFDEDRLIEVQLKCLVGTLPEFRTPASRDAAGSACAKLYRTDFLRDNNLCYIEGLKRAEDMLFNLMVFGKAKRVGYLYDFLYDYRQLDSSATYQYRENGISVFTDTLMHMKDYLAKANVSDRFMQVYYMRCMFFFLESMDMDYSNPANPKKYAVRRSELAKVVLNAPYDEAVRNLRLSSLAFARKIPLILIRLKLFGLLMLFYRVYGIVRGGH